MTSEPAAAGRIARTSAWLDRQDPASLKGVVIGTWRTYRRVEGPAQTALLAVWVLVAVLPALLVMEDYRDAHPSALANELSHHYGLSRASTDLLRSVLVQDRHHEVGTTVLAILGALVFGTGFGRALRLVTARAWEVELPERLTDQLRYVVSLFVLYALILLALVEVQQLAGDPPWTRLVLAPVWVLLLAGYFLWIPRLLTHGLVAWRDLLPAAVATAVGLVLLMWVSSVGMQLWLDLYAEDYGGFGVVMAIYFWLVLATGMVVFAACAAPALAARRERRLTGAGVRAFR